MKVLLIFIGGWLLFVLCWPLALLGLGLGLAVGLVVLPLVWLLCLPFKVIGIIFEAVFALLRAVLMLPARLLGVKG